MSKKVGDKNRSPETRKLVENLIEYGHSNKEIIEICAGLDRITNDYVSVSRSRLKKKKEEETKQNEQIKQMELSFDDIDEETCDVKNTEFIEVTPEEKNLFYALLLYVDSLTRGTNEKYQNSKTNCN